MTISEVRIETVREDLFRYVHQFEVYAKENPYNTAAIIYKKDGIVNLALSLITLQIINNDEWESVLERLQAVKDTI